MVIRAVIGERHEVNRVLLTYAVRNRPCLVIDTAQAVNPPVFFPYVLPEEWDEVFVVPVELLYSFRQNCRELVRNAKAVGANRVVIMAFKYLIAYHDDVEIENVIAHSWELLVKNSGELDVVIGLHPAHEKFAKAKGVRCVSVSDFFA